MEIMKLINSNRDAIIAELRDADMAALGNGNCEYRVYIDTEGDADYEVWACGDRAHYEFREPGYDRFYIGTFSYEYFDILWDGWFNSAHEFAAAFKSRFGIDLDQDRDRSLYDDAISTLTENGIGESDLEDWLSEERTAAKEQACEDTDYEEILRQSILENGYDDDDDDDDETGWY